MLVIAERDLGICVDSREQMPYRFDGATYEALPTGDYTAAEVRDLLCIERKSLSDFIGCVGQSRDRFERCLERMSRFRWPHLVCEFSLRDLARGNWRGKIQPAHAIGSLFGWAVRFRVTPWLCGDRTCAKATVRQIIEKSVRQARRERGEGVGRGKEGHLLNTEGSTSA